MHFYNNLDKIHYIVESSNSCSGNCIHHKVKHMSFCLRHKSIFTKFKYSNFSFCHFLKTSIFLFPLSYSMFFFICRPVMMSYSYHQTKQDETSVPPIVLMHGLFGSKNNWRSLSKQISAKTGRAVKQLLLCIMILNYN